MALTIPRFVHRCIVQSGDMAGSKFSHEVAAAEFEYGTTCDECGEPLVTPNQLLAHIYAHVTGESD